METEGRLVEYVCRATYGDLPPSVLEVVKNQVLTELGTTIAGAETDGWVPLVNLYNELGGKGGRPSSSTWGKVPAPAALLNGVMARALVFCDALAPGAHIGSSVVPAALAAIECYQEEGTGAFVGLAAAERFSSAQGNSRLSLNGRSSSLWVY